MNDSTGATVSQVPDVSLIMPCYNEEDNVGYTIPRLVEAFRQAGHAIQLVAVNNGSVDRTAQALRDLAARYPEITIGHVEKNIGFGNGLLTGIPLCTAPWVGTVAADGQVDAEDVVRLFEATSSTRGDVLGKVRRRFRMDGLARKLVSVSYNSFVHVLWPTVGSWDVNGQPRMIARQLLLDMRLESVNWFIDPEMIIKAHHMGVRILEVNVFARMRGNGLSHVKATTCWEFLRCLLAFRLKGVPAHLRHYRSGQKHAASAARHASV
jgi:glycosyltransferase involved in cell wall biosynthesis